MPTHTLAPDPPRKRQRILFADGSWWLIEPIYFPLAASSVEAAAQTKPSAEDAAAEQEKIDRVALMDRKQSEISKRVGMSSCLEISDAGSEGFVAIALERGLIVEVTLDEVDAALKAAAATPEREDDLAAMHLAHWESYRFFLDDMPAVPTPHK